MLQLYPVYLLCNRRKTLTGSPDPTRANGTNKPCIYIRAKAKVKATSLMICCIVSYLCVYTTVTTAATKIKEKIAFVPRRVSSQSSRIPCCEMSPDTEVCHKIGKIGRWPWV